MYLPGLKVTTVLFGHVHLLAGPRIAGLPGRPRLHLEDTEIPQLDPSVSYQGLDNRVKGLLDDFLRLLLSQPDFFRDRSHDVFLSHSDSPENRNAEAIVDVNPYPLST